MTCKIMLTGHPLAGDALDLAASLGATLVPTATYASENELAALMRSEQPDAIIMRGGKITRDMIAACTRLKIIAKHGVGYDGIDIQAAAQRGIPVTITLGANAQSVAEHAFALMFAVARQIALTHSRVQANDWAGAKAASQGMELFGKTLGLVGMGAIGGILMDLVAPLRMRVKVYDPFLKVLPDGPHVERETDFARLLQEADIISLHCPLTEATRNLFGPEQFAHMRQGSVLINTARGELIDADALAHALRGGRLAGAGLDTVHPEPLAADSPLRGLPNLIVTPHIGANTAEAKAKVGLMAVQQVVDALQGKAPDPRCVVNRHLFEA